ncbi:MAG: VWA domain-containing protein [Pyrinomonadaceae bacterium]|nr:VWA domain-containing protein [Pyrinomonadaceae bacterium]
MRKVFGIILIISFGYFSVPMISAQEERPRRVEPSVSNSSSTASETPEEVGQGEVIRVDTSLVTIPVSVRDRQGRFIYDLSKEDFSVYENDVRQETAFFESIETPFTVILMLDTSSSTWLKHEKIKDAAIAFVNQLRPDDRVMVVSFANETTVEIEPTNDRMALQQAIRKVGKGWNTRLYDAVDWAIKGPLKRIPGRKAVVLLTDGMSTKCKHATYKTNIRDVEELDALIYPVQYDTSEDMALMTGGASGPPPSLPSNLPSILSRLPSTIPGPGIGRPKPDRDAYKIAGAYLRELAEKTGGRLYQAGENGGSLRAAFRQIVEELSHQYRLGYYPKTQARVRERRRLRVRINRSDVSVRARDSYVYEPSLETKNGKASASQ